ncbi:MAG TPA: cation transporter [Caulobacteraceae bacterium]|jgi:Co/Zn/Cd efflux system component|nr:cation transporter [Caulobacteraceae bacterium]
MDGFRRAALIAGLANLAYFGVEFVVALSIRSVSLFADSIDFLEDMAVNFLIVVALGWSARRRGAVGMALAATILAPAVATLWTAWQKLLAPTPPAVVPLTLTALGAMLVNFGCAFLLARHRDHHGSLSRAAFLSARNDVLANLAIIAAGGATLVVRNAWPDLIVGLGIAALNADAAREVWEAARKERLQPAP